ncbi:MAG: thioredoxin family protein [Chloroflexi bacterium]|nr:thioredoxin family protein [Chloroflexota bacterium]
MAKPVVDGLERDLQGQAQVLRLSVTDEVGGILAHRYGVRGVPAFVLFDGTGQVALSFAGIPDRNTVRQAVADLTPG